MVSKSAQIPSSHSAVDIPLRETSTKDAPYQQWCVARSPATAPFDVHVRGHRSPQSSSNHAHPACDVAFAARQEMVAWETSGSQNLTAQMSDSRGPRCLSCPN